MLSFATNVAKWHQLLHARTVSIHSTAYVPPAVSHIDKTLAPPSHEISDQCLRIHKAPAPFDLVKPFPTRAMPPPASTCLRP